MIADSPSATLLSVLAEEPVPLQFGTSGRRGLLVHLSQLEVFVNALAELEYLQSLPREQGGIARGDVFYFAYDLRPSSSQFVEGQSRRGELAQAIESAIQAAGMTPVNLGRIPTPALMHFALSRGRGSIMITGSHIPFDRNGYKTNTSCGELLKQHESPINAKVAEVRERIYHQPYVESPFDRYGMFKTGHHSLSAEMGAAAEEYLSRYAKFFGNQCLCGKRLLVFQHSAVGRDLLVDILAAVGAEVFVAGRSETFVPIDTENIDASQLAAIQALLDDAVVRHGPMDAVVSTDGDSDRPMILAVDNRTSAVRFFGGDLVGMIAAEFLGADAAVVPISCNDAIDRGALKHVLEPKTRIGSPFVIAGMDAACRRGKRTVCGWEANGGFLTASDIRRGGRILTALPTRDAVLPILAVLSAAQEHGISLIDLFGRLPKRYSRAALLKQFPRSVGLAIVNRFTPKDSVIGEVQFLPAGVRVTDREGRIGECNSSVMEELQRIRHELEGFFPASSGFGRISSINLIDGVRILFANGDVAHLRPSGNADELRIYAVADTQARADAIAETAVEEPDGILRRLERHIR